MNSGKLVAGLDYAMVSNASFDFGQRLATDAALRERLAVLQNRLSK
jgi:hypothetical protein